MAPLRRARAAAATRSAPYRGGESLVSRCRRARRGLDGEKPLEHGVVTSSALLHDDALAAVFARHRDDGPAVVRCAVACRRWARVVSQDAAALSRALPPLGSLALGFFHHDDDDGQPRPFFVPTTSGSRLLGSTASSLLDGVHGVDLDCSRPVASRNGRLVLELPREGSLKLCVCDPMTGAADVLPPLSGEDCPGYYVCALLTGEDADPPVFSPAYFRLLLLYNRSGFTALRRYASDTGSCGPEAKGDLRISPEWLRHVAPATALRGVVYWSVDRHAFGVRLDGASASHKLDQYITSYVTPKRIPLSTSTYSVIGVLPDGRLYLVTLNLVANKTVAVQTFSLRNEASDHDIFTRRWEEQEWSKAIRLDQFDVTRATAMACRWYSEKSRVLFFTLGEGSSVRGTFALNMETRALEKVADRDSWKNFCGYEMGREVYFKSLIVPH